MYALSAVHEAAHATVSCLLGEMPEEVTIRLEELPEGLSEGHTRYLGVESRAIAEAAVFGRSPADRERVMRFLIGVAAGPVPSPTTSGVLGHPSWTRWPGASSVARWTTRWLSVSQRRRASSSTLVWTTLSTRPATCWNSRRSGRPWNRWRANSRGS